MKLEKSLFQKSHFYFIGFFLLMIAAFWLTYFTKIADQENYRLHTHGVVLVLWCLMLIIQPYLIRAKKKALHKQIGKLSYLLVPLIVITTIDLFKYRLNQQTGDPDYFAVALVLNALVAFILLYGLAIYHRKKSVIHARYMICTAFPMFTPVTDRIIHIYFPSLLPHLYSINGVPIAPVVGFAMADLILLGLSIWDWRSHKRWNVFPTALLILMIYHFSVLNFYKYDFWKTFSNWFAGL